MFIVLPKRICVCHSMCVCLSMNKCFVCKIDMIDTRVSMMPSKIAPLNEVAFRTQRYTQTTKMNQQLFNAVNHLSRKGSISPTYKTHVEPLTRCELEVATLPREQRNTYIQKQNKQQKIRMWHKCPFINLR